LRLAIFTNNQGLFDLIEACLAGEGANCHRYAEEVELARALLREEFAAIVFDAAAGLDASHPVLARRACYGDRRAPLIAIGDFGVRDQVIAAMSAGADDIVLMPVDPRELRLRFYLAVQRFATHPEASGACAPADDEFATGRFRLNRRDTTVHVDGRAVRLTAREFAIAWVLFSQQGNYVTRRAIAATVWGSSEEIVGRTLEQHIYKLRKKLLLDGSCGVTLRTMYAHGYRIERWADPVNERGMARVVERIAEHAANSVSKPFPKPDASCAPRSSADCAIKLHTSGSEAACSAQPWDPDSADAWTFAAASRSRRTA
jgi:DNA-binding response OmpR family regulator